jgi:hypothetical protein
VPRHSCCKYPPGIFSQGEIIAKLKALTKLRIVRYEEFASGWKLEVGSFPGWETVPEW